jgi:hypothetical protein
LASDKESNSEMKPRPIPMPPSWQCIAVALVCCIAGCATAWPVDHPNNWVTRDGRYIANPEVYYSCLQAARHMETETQSIIGGGAFGRGTGAVSGSSESRQTMKTDVPLLTACMASKGYRLRTPEEKGSLPYETSTSAVTAPHQAQRGAWAFEVRKDPDVVWIGGWTPGWTADTCESRRRDAQTRKPETIVSPCRYQIITDEPPGTEAWVTLGVSGFVGAPTQSLCEQFGETIRKESTGATVLPCRRAWVRTP